MSEVKPVSSQFQYAIQFARDVAEDAVNVYPTDDQKFLAAEKMGELIQAVSHHRRGRGGSDELTSAEQVVSECADVIIMTLQMALLHGTEAELSEALTSKSARLSTRIAAMVGADEEDAES